MSASIDQQFIEFVVKSLVNHPDAVEVKRTIDEKGVLLELTVNPEDLGRVIGKRGATAQSLRTLLRALGTKNDARYNLKIVDNGERPERPVRDEQSPRTVSDSPVSQTTDDPDDAVAAVSDDEGSTAQEETKTEEDVKTDIDDTSDVISKTRKELDDLDDLDI